MTDTAWSDEDIARGDAVRLLNNTPTKVLGLSEEEADALATWAGRQGWATDLRWASAEGRRGLAAARGDLP